MSFYIRKSVSVGPFRFNFSKSGVGVSTGFNGFRVGTGPRGNYISVGRGGLYYRATLPATRQLGSPKSPQINEIPTPVSESGVGEMVAIESAPVTEMRDTSSSDLLSELNGKAKRPNYWKWVAGGSFIALGAIPATAPNWALPLACISAIVLVAYVAVRDSVARTAVLCYDLDEQSEKAYGQLHDAFQTLGACSKAWRIDARAAVHDSKYHAGAGALVKRKDAHFGKGLPPKVKCNIDAPFVKASNLSLYFMPDRVLVYSSSGVGAVSYKALRLEGSSRQFIESDSVPRDSAIVGKTWKYVNKKGGPDKRFKDNRELPITLYEELSFKSESGLNEVYQVSKHSLTDVVGSALRGMNYAVPA